MRYERLFHNPYVKLNIRSGKTCLGKALKGIFDFLKDSNPAHLYEMATGEGASFSIDYVNGGYRLQRLSAGIDAVKRSLSQILFLRYRCDGFV